MTKSLTISNPVSTNTASTPVLRDTSGNFSAGTITAALSGNASTVTNGVYTTGSYADPSWITSINYSKLTGTIPTWNQNTTGTASNVTGTIAIANGGTGATTASGARTGLGATTAGSNLFTLTNPSAITFLRINADNTVSTLDAATFRSAIGAGTSSTTGTVTSVSLSLPTIFSVSGSPVTTTGTLTASLSSQTANTFFAAPNGAAGVPTFRAIVAADIPTLNQNTTGTAANVTGTVAVANGGTGATTAANARTNLGATYRGLFATSPESSVSAADIRNLTNPTTGLGYADGVRFRFSSLNDDNSTPYADVIDLSTYQDSSGGGFNSLYFHKDQHTILHKYAVAGATTWTTKTLAYTDSNITGTSANVTGTVAIANGGTGATTAAAARTSLGATTAGSSLFTLANPSAVTFLRVNADNTVSTLDAATFRTAIGAGTSSTTGTVTSVSGTGTVSGLSLSGNVTSTGNLTLGGALSVTASNFSSQTANTFLAAPNGAAGVPTFRAIVAADIPTLNQNTTGTSFSSGYVTGQGTITYGSGRLQWTDLSGAGGTGLSGSTPTNPSNDWYHHIILNHANAGGYYFDIAGCFHTDTLAFRRLVNGSLTSWRYTLHDGNFNSYAPTLTGTGASGTWNIGISGNAGTVTNGVYTSGSYADPSWITSINYSKLTGTIPTWNQNTTGTASNVTGTVAIANGGTGATSAQNARLAIMPSITGNAGKVLAVNGAATDFEYVALGGTGTVTSVGVSVPSFLSVANSPITTTGTIAISYSGTALPVANGGTGTTAATGSGSVVLSNTPTLIGTRETKVAMPANDINLSNGNLFTKTISGATTMTVSNVPSTGTTISFILDLTNGGSSAITWFSGVKWAGGTAPTLTASGRDVIGFFTHDAGTTWTGLLLGKDVK